MLKLNQEVVLIKNLKKVKIEAISEDKLHYLISYFDKRYKQAIVTENDILTEKEYSKVRMRVNKINSILG